MKVLLPLVTIAALAALTTPSVAQAQTTFYQSFTNFSAATNTTLIEDFESVTPKNTQLSSFTHNAITYSGTGGSNVYVAASGFTNFGVPVTASAVLTSNANEDFLITPGTARPAIGFDTYTNTFGPVRVEAFGASGSLGVYLLTQDSTKVGFLGITSTSLISSVRWTGVNGGQINTGIDNVRLGSVTASAPEPSGLALALMPLAVLARAIARRRKAC